MGAPVGYRGHVHQNTWEYDYSPGCFWAWCGYCVPVDLVLHDSLHDILWQPCPLFLPNQQYFIYAIRYTVPNTTITEGFGILQQDLGFFTDQQSQWVFAHYYLSITITYALLQSGSSLWSWTHCDRWCKAKNTIKRQNQKKQEKKGFVRQAKWSEW